MPDWLEFLFYLAAFICLLLAAFARDSKRLSRVNLIALGLALWVFVPLSRAFDALT